MSSPTGPRTRVEVYDALPAAGGGRVDFVPREDVLGCVVPDPVDRSGDLQLTLRATARVRAAVYPQRVLRLVHVTPSGDVAQIEHRRIRTVRATWAAGELSCTVTAAPLLEDWAAVGWIRTQVAGERPVFDFSGIYTPAQVFALVLDYLASVEQTHWAPGVIDRDDPKELQIVRMTPAEVLRLAEQTWASEAHARTPAPTDESEHVVDFLERRGAGATVVRLDRRGGLLRVARTLDGNRQATVVLPTGAADASIEHAAWRITSAETTTDWVECVDPSGGRGLVVVDGQWVGAYLQRADGTLAAIVDSERGDGFTSRLRLADASGITAGAAGVGDELELRADSAGSRVVEVTNPGAIAMHGRIAVPLARPDVGGARNYVPNPRGAAYTDPDAPPTGWTTVATGAGDPPTITRLTSGYPGDLPLEDVGFCWRVHFDSGTGAGLNPGQALRTALLPLLDRVSGDSLVAWVVWLYVDRDLHDAAIEPVGTYVQPRPSVRLRTEGGTVVDTAAFEEPAGQALGQQWVRLGKVGLTLTSDLRAHLEIVLTDAQVVGTASSDGPDFPLEGVDVYVLAAQVTRSAEALPWVEYPQANLLVQAANAHAHAYGDPPATYELGLDDRARRDPTRYGDQPLVSGGDVHVVLPELGLDDRVRVVSQTPDLVVPGQTAVTAVAAPDPTVAAALAAAAPSRRRSLSEVLRAVAAGRGSSPAS